MGRPAAVILTALHAGGKFGGGGYKVSGDYMVGSSVVKCVITRFKAYTVMKQFIIKHTKKACLNLILKK